MLSALKSLFTGLGAAMVALSAWWTKTQTARETADAQESARTIDAAPAAEFLRRFKPDAGASSATTDIGKRSDK